MKTLCVFVGAQPGKKPLYSEAAIKLSEELVKNNITLIYGGGKFGLMGILADTVLASGGKVVGIIPKNLQDQAHANLSELHVVESMQERKKK